MAKNPDRGSPKGNPPAAGQPLPVETVSTPEGDFSISFTPRAESDESEAGGPVAEGSASQAAATAPAAERASFAAESGTDGSFFGQLTGIPIEYLVATPLLAAARSNMALAQVMVEFINEIGFNKDGKTNIISFDLTREVQQADGSGFKPQTITVNAPLLALVPIPALLVQSVNVDLTVEVSQTISENSSSEAKASVSASDSWGFGSVSVTGSYTNSQSRTRATNQSAKYQINVTAQQQPAAEGMSRLMDVFASTVTPIPTGK